MGEAKQPLEVRGLGQEQRDCPRALRPFLRAAEDLSRTRKRRAQVLALAVRSLARLDLAVRAAQQRVDLGGAGGSGGELRGVEIQVEAEDGLCESTRVDQRAQVSSLTSLSELITALITRNAPDAHLEW